MKRILLTLSACALVLGFGVSAPLRAETIKLRIASGHPPGVVYAGLMKDFFEPEFKKAVESRTKHKLSSPVIAKASTTCTYSLDPITLSPQPSGQGIIGVSHFQLLLPPD